MGKGLKLKRFHKKRIKNKRKNDIAVKFGANLNKHVVTPSVCSCEACGNPRNHFGNGWQSKTIQELRVDSDERNS